MIPVLETKRLILRAPAVADAESYQKNFADYEVIRHLLAIVPWPYPEDGVKHYLEKEIMPKQGHDFWSWGLFEKDRPSEMIGGVSLWRECRPSNRGFWLGKDYWGRGYMTEAVRPVTDYAFEGLGFTRLVFDNAVGNSRSARIKEKQGCVRIGRQPLQCVDPIYKEMELWELTRESWFKAHHA